MSNIPQFDLGRFKAIAIGASTGAPGLVEQILMGLPADLPVPIFLAQHMPPHFTASYAARLQLRSPMTVVHTEHKMPVFPGTVYVGQGHRHLRIRKSNKSEPYIEIDEEPKKLVYKPSVDELFQSCVEVYGHELLAIIMSGIGQDGTEGAQQVHAAGGMIITQSRETCAVYGMPRNCVEAGLSEAQLTPAEIRQTIIQLSPDQRRHTA